MWLDSTVQKSRRILLTGGGTAGHVNPALAIGKALDGDSAQFLYVGVSGKAEEEIVPREQIPIRFVRASGFPMTLSLWPILRFALDLLAGVIQAAFILLHFRPHIIVGAGGYASAPVVMAGYLLRKMKLNHARVYIHEQNAVPGKLNRLMGRFSHNVFVTFPETLAYFPKNGVLAGYPLRRQISRLSRETAIQRLDFEIPAGRKIIFVFGGSQGARSLNNAVIDALRFFLPHHDRIFIIHGTGLFKTSEYRAAEDTQSRMQQLYNGDELRIIEEFYVTHPFFHNIECLYSAADIVVVRGGAGSINEVSAMGLPAILVPKADLPGDHQVMNARAMQKSGGAKILYEEVTSQKGQLTLQLDGKLLAETILGLASNEPLLKEMANKSLAFLNHDAAAIIRERILGGLPIETHADLSSELSSQQDPLPDNRTLLSLLERSLAESKDSYSPAAVIKNPDDLIYLKNRAASLLTSSAWETRNLGVKLLGLLKAADQIPLLLVLYNDRRPAFWLKRLFGGDYEQVGFIRRNILSALVRLGQLTPEVEEAILLSFTDPYYEVRAEGARAAAQLGPGLSRLSEIVALLIKQLCDRNLEAAGAAAIALGEVGGAEDALPALLALNQYKYWKLRAAALRGIHSLLERKRVYDLNALSKALPGFVLSSTDFEPQYEIKNIYRDLIRTASKAKAREQ
jgi:UDP-N-acetylglucosamine--N-acetylmuramyl-(pentapeptide) pyrophosphoryl-undecaprenol N-acetylglucosamine transferase